MYVWFLYVDFCLKYWFSLWNNIMSLNMCTCKFVYGFYEIINIVFYDSHDIYTFIVAKHDFPKQLCVYARLLYWFNEFMFFVVLISLDICKYVSVYVYFGLNELLSLWYNIITLKHWMCMYLCWLLYLH